MRKQLDMLTFKNTNEAVLQTVFVFYREKEMFHYVVGIEELFFFFFYTQNGKDESKTLMR